MGVKPPALRRSESMALDAAEKVIPIIDGSRAVSFATDPERYLHWHLSIDGSVATLAMDVDEQRGLRPGYAMKLNSYDLGVDIELHDAVQRLRFEHPEVGCVVITSAKDRCFSAGANIGMLAQASHAWKVNFCKFTNETRLEMEDASANSGQTYLAAVNGAAAGGGRGRARRSCSSTTAHRLFHSRNCRCSRCCRQPAASRVSVTSDMCAGTWPMSSSPRARASRRPWRWSGVSSTPRFRADGSMSRYEPALLRSRLLRPRNPDLALGSNRS